MKFITSTLAATAALLATSMVSAQQLPTCADNCVSQLLSSTGCNTQNIACICSNTQFIQEISCCLLPVCSASDIQSAINYANSICGLAGVSNLPKSATCASTATSSSAAAAATSSAASSSAAAASTTSMSSASAMSSSAALSMASSSTAAKSSSASASTTGAASSVASAASSAASSASAVASHTGNAASGLVHDVKTGWKVTAVGVVVAGVVGVLGLAL